MFAENIEDVLSPTAVNLYQGFLDGYICCHKNSKKSWCVQNRVIFLEYGLHRTEKITKELTLLEFITATFLEEVQEKWEDKLKVYRDNLQNNHLKVEGSYYTYFYFNLDNIYYYKNQIEQRSIGQCHPDMFVRDIDHFEYKLMTEYEINFFRGKILGNMFENFHI